MSGTRHTTKAPRKRSCVGKWRFSTLAGAEQYRQHRISRGAAPWQVSVYRCRFCLFRHVGHSMAEKYRRSARR